MVEPDPAAPIILRDGQHLADGGTTLIKKLLLGRFDFITLRDGGAAGVMRFAYI
jgi:hypothetical protein